MASFRLRRSSQLFRAKKRSSSDSPEPGDVNDYEELRYQNEDLSKRNRQLAKQVGDCRARLQQLADVENCNRALEIQNAQMRRAIKHCYHDLELTRRNFLQDIALINADSLLASPERQIRRRPASIHEEYVGSKRRRESMIAEESDVGSKFAANDISDNIKIEEQSRSPSRATPIDVAVERCSISRRSSIENATMSEYQENVELEDEGTPPGYASNIDLKLSPQFEASDDSPYDKTPQCNSKVEITNDGETHKSTIRNHRSTSRFDVTLTDLSTPSPDPMPTKDIPDKIKKATATKIPLKRKLVAGRNNRTAKSPRCLIDIDSDRESLPSSATRARRAVVKVDYREPSLHAKVRREDAQGWSKHA